MTAPGSSQDIFRRLKTNPPLLLKDQDQKSCLKGIVDLKVTPAQAGHGLLNYKIFFSKKQKLTTLFGRI
jgi:hypothetical protein